MMLTPTHRPGQHNEFLSRMGGTYTFYIFCIPKKIACCQVFRFLCLDKEFKASFKNLQRQALSFQKDYVEQFDFLADPYFGNLLTDHNKGTTKHFVCYKTSIFFTFLHVFWCCLDIRNKKPTMSVQYGRQQAALDKKRHLKSIDRSVPFEENFN